MDPDAFVGDVVAAAVVSGTLSGAPSTVHALATGRSPLAAARAAGELLGRPGLVRGGVAHAGITMFWSTVLAATLPRGREVAAGAAAGLAIAALDLGIIGRRFPAIAALPSVPQVLDHIAFGVAVGATLAHRRRRPVPLRPRPRAPAGQPARSGPARAAVMRMTTRRSRSMAAR